jgi:hypothetical protein
LPPRDLSGFSRNKVQRNDSLVQKAVDNNVALGPKPTQATKPSARATTRTKLGRMAKSPRSAKPAPKVSIVGAKAFATLCNQPEVQLFTMSFAELGVELSSTQAEPSGSDPDLFQIPSEYHKYADLFSKQEALKLPSH